MIAVRNHTLWIYHGGRFSMFPDSGRNHELLARSMGLPLRIWGRAQHDHKLLTFCTTYPIHHPKVMFVADHVMKMWPTYAWDDTLLSVWKG